MPFSYDVALLIILRSIESIALDMKKDIFWMKKCNDLYSHRKVYLNENDVITIMT